MTEPVRWGFVGAGWIAHRALAPAVHCADGAVLHAASSREPARAQTLGPVVTYEAYENLLGDDEVEAVYISLHNSAHLPWTLAALDAGKHVLCEKPLGLTADEVRVMAEAARAADRLVVEATWSLWHPRTQRARALIASDAIGPVHAVHAGFRFRGVPDGNYRLDPRHGGGALYDLGPYAVGAALWAVPGVDVAVEQCDVRRSAQGVDLSTDAQLLLGSARAHVRVSIDDDYGEWVRVEGERGSLELSSPAHTSWLAPSTLTVQQADETIVQHVAPLDPYQRMVEHVSRAVRGDTSAFVMPIDESVRVAEAMDAIRRADEVPQR